MAGTPHDEPEDPAAEADARPDATLDELRERNQDLAVQLAELRARAEGLEAENDTLRRENERSNTAVIAGGDAHPARPARKRRGWGWTLLATVLVVIGAILAPVAVVSTWAQRELSDGDYFVATFAPLAKQPGVQSLVTDQVTKAVESSIDIDALTKQVFDGVAKAGLPPAAADALRGLAGPAADGIRGLIQSTVSSFVQSQAFADLWTQTLRTAHAQLGETMSGSSNAVITIGNGGEISLQLAPVVQAVKKVLVDKGFSLAKNIPEIKKSIVVAHVASASLIQSIYQLTLALGTWLPWLVLLLLVVGVVVARRRALALVWAAVALFLSMLLVAIGVSVGKTVFVLSVSSVMSASAATTIYATVLQFVSSIVLAVAVLAITVAIVAYLAGPFRFPRRLRGLTGEGFGRLRGVGDAHGLSTGAAGRWIYRQRVLLRVAVAVIAAVIVLFARPLSPALIIWTAVIAVLVLIALELVQRPENADAPAQSAAAEG